ncbi:MAG: DNA polymerase III subunit alpha [Chloroflexi bacterium]|nr:DNA polymerase III subunit alpha [Chloroflexota bacterium]
MEGGYAELHCHSYYSFHDGASSLEELLLRAKDLGYSALAITDHDNLCGAMRFAHLSRSVGVRGIIGAEVTLRGGYHLTLLARNRQGYSDLCRLITSAHISGRRNGPELDPALLPQHAGGLIALSGCPRGEVACSLAGPDLSRTLALVGQYLEWFGEENYYIELQQNLVYGDTARNRKLVEVSKKTGARLVATGNVHYHVRERHQLQDSLVAIRNCKSLEETHRERRPNSEFYLRPIREVQSLFREWPEARSNTLKIAEMCSFDLASELDYAFPDYQVPEGYTVGSYLRKLCEDAAVRRYGTVTPRVRRRLDEEFSLIEKYNLSGFLLQYHEVIRLGREAMLDLGLSDPSLTLEEDPPGRGRGSSVALLVGYLIGLSHIDPLQYELSLERFLPQDTMVNVPDIDLDFPRSIREELILRVHQRWGWKHAALTGTIVTYQIKGAIRGLGKALGLPEDEVDRLARHVGYGSAKEVEAQMLKLPGFCEKAGTPVWNDLARLSAEMDGFPKYLGQHPGGMVLSSTPLTDMVPVQHGAIEGRYVCQWDKDSIDDAGFIKIDFLALGALSQLQEAVGMIKDRTGRRVDLSRIDFNDASVYDMMCCGDTIGIFQVESAAQMQTIIRLKPRNLVDMAHEVGAVRPGVGVNDGVREYLMRRTHRKPVTYDTPLEKRALERTLGVILFQDQVNQVAVDVAGFTPSEADRLRRAFGRKHNTELIGRYWQKFREGAISRGVGEEAAQKIFRKFNGEYMFPESHAFAFGVTAYQAAWLKRYYPLEFFVAIFNQQPMGFYNLETLKEDAKRHGIKVLNPDINKSEGRCAVEDGALRLGLLNVLDVGAASTEAVLKGREKGGPFISIGDFLERTGILEEAAVNLASAGAFDCLEANRRKVKWEIGLRYRPVNSQLTLPLPVEQDLIDLEKPGDWESMRDEYSVLGLFPAGHIMARLRPSLEGAITCSRDIARLKDGAEVMTAGLVIRRQRPLSKAVFITLEDEFGHIPLMVWPQVYERYENRFKDPFLVVRGKVSRRDGTENIMVTGVESSFSAMERLPKAKNWG